MDKLLTGSMEKKEPALYSTLGCSRGSTLEQIQAEYRFRVRSLHPDKLSTAEAAEKSEQFASLQNAYVVLSDPAQRQQYDMWLDSPLPMDYEEFCKNSDSIKMSMHWAAPKQTPMISLSELSGGGAKKDELAKNDWEKSRYQSETAKRFRNYEL